MAKKFILKTLDTNTSNGRHGGNRPFERNLLNLSTIGIKWNTNLIKQVRTDTDYAGSDNYNLGGVNSSMVNGYDDFMRNHGNIAGQNDFIAYFDQNYVMRRDFLRKFALQGEIDYVIETIADEVIVNDDMHYFAYPNNTQLKSILKPDVGQKIVNEINTAYRRVYHMFHFNEGNDAWHYCKKFLIDGFLAFEIIYSDNGKNRAGDIIGFKELDPTKLVPEIRLDANSNEYKVWVLNKGDVDNERVLLDTNIIYISWAKTNFISHLSYCERLVRSFNMLRTIENSRVIWNIQNAQKRVKIVVPVGTESYQKQRTRLRELEAMYKEDIMIDNMSGEITVNGQPKFPFSKTFIFPSKDGTQTDISEMGIEGHDMNTTETLKWFWQRFIIETRLPKDRFNMLFDGAESSVIKDNNTMTKEEYRFSLFVGRIRDIIKELLIKPTWIQFCLKNPEFANNNVLKNALGLQFVEENVFTLAKEGANLQIGTTIISNLSGLQHPDGTPVFSTEFLVKRYLSFTDDDWKQNDKMLQKEKEEAANAQGGPGGAPGGDMGGDTGGDFGAMEAPPADSGLGGDLGGDMGGGEAPAPEPSPEPAPAE